MSVALKIQNPPRRRHDERGAAVVEFALASTILLVLLFGIITYGYVLSFKQALTQAAAEGARKAAVSTAATAAANAAPAVQQAANAFNKTCNPLDSDGLACTYSMLPADTGCALNVCMRVRVSYDYKNHPLLPKFPGLGLLIPDTIQSTSITQVS